jgi:5-methylthioadenosine/S-adenosylhomocysteine deaminase
VELPEQILIPGLINGHAHSAMTLLRGVADDVPLMDWLQNHIWPLEKKWVSEAWTYLGSKLAAAEGLRSGTTYINDMYFFPTAMARAAVDSGMRAAVSMNVIDFPTGYASGPDDYIAKGVAAYEQYKGEKLLDWTSAPHAPTRVRRDLHQLRDLAESWTSRCTATSTRRRVRCRRPQGPRRAAHRAAGQAGPFQRAHDRRAHGPPR